MKALSDAAERAWWRLTTACDDYGRFDADPEVLLADLFKRRPAGWTVRKMTAVLDEWEQALIHRYAAEENGVRVYGHVLTFAHHQRERDSKPKYPDPPCAVAGAEAEACQESRAKSPANLDSPQLAANCGSRARAPGPRDVVLERRSAREPIHGALWRTASSLLSFLNTKAGRSYRPMPATLGPIMARLREGATEANCRGVIARKVRDWTGDPRMVKYLRPETLFNRTKFESYLGERETESADG